MTASSNVPPPTVLSTQEPATPETVKVAGRIVRTKSFLSKQLKTTVPAFAAGVITTVVVASRRSRKQDSELDVDNYVDDSTE